MDNVSGDDSSDFPSVCSKNHEHYLTKSSTNRKESVISNIALSKRRKSSRFLGTTFDSSSPGSLANQAYNVPQLNLVQLAQLQRLQKLKLLHNYPFNSTAPKMNQLLNKSNGGNDKQPTEYAKTNISSDKMFNQVRVFC